MKDTNIKENGKLRVKRIFALILAVLLVLYMLISLCTEWYVLLREKIKMCHMVKTRH